MLAVRRAATSRETDDKFDWTKTWVAEMFLSGEEIKRRKEELELRRGITPEVKRLREIKAGVITASVGVGAGIFLFVLMQGIILGGKIQPHAVEILSRLWVVGVIPFFVGIALIVNGVFFNPARRKSDTAALDGDKASVKSLEANEFLPPSFSVTDETTRQLRDSNQKY
jgi:hypothetical protein